MVSRASQKAKSQVIRAEERLAAIEESKDAIKAQMENVATQVSRQNSEDFLKLAEERLGKVNVEAEKDHAARKKEVEDLVGPIKDSLHKLQESTDRIEKERGAYQGLKRTVKDSGSKLRTFAIQTSSCQLLFVVLAKIGANGAKYH